MSGKLPAIQFYVGDWLRDPVSCCSLAAQGLWFRMMMLMHDAEVYGRLEVGGKPMTQRQICRGCGVSTREYRRLLDQLMSLSVPSLDKNGVIFSRRMVRDAEKRAKNTERMRRFRNGDVTDLCTLSSSSSSTSTSASTLTPDLETVLAKASMIGCKPEWAEEFFDHYESQGWLKASGLRITNWQTALKRWAEKNRAEPSTSKGRGTGGSASSNAYALDIKAKAYEEEKGKLERHRAEVAGGDFIWDDPKAKTRWFEVRKELASIAKEKQSI